MENIKDSQNQGIKKTLYILIAFIAITLGVFFSVHFGSKDKNYFTSEKLDELNSIVFESPRIINFFNLIDNQKAPFTKEKLQGSWSLFYFGYTFCPDICPASLGQLNQVENYIAEKNPKFSKTINYIMVTVDPNRDNIDKLGKYVKYFNENFIGVSGPVKDIHSLTVQMNVPYTPIIDPEDEFYLVDHGANLAITDPSGNYIGIIKPPFIGAKVLELLEQLNKRYVQLTAK